VSANGNPIASDGYVDVKIFCKTTSSNKVFGEDGLKTGFAVDYSTTDWQEPVVSVRGVKTSDSFSGLNANDLSILSGYEDFFLIGQVGDTDVEIDYYQKAKSGVNPSGDIQLRFLAEGRYASSVLPNTVLTGIFDDSTNNYEVRDSTKNNMTMIID
jgi:hypothetical protein